MLEHLSGTEAEAALFRQFFEISPDGLVLVDHADRVLKANPAWLQLFGYRLDEVEGQPINSLIVDPAFHQEASEISHRALNQQLVHLESLRCTKQGDLIHVEIFGTPIAVDEQQIGIYAMYRDITARRQAEDLLSQSEAKHRSIVETMEDGFYEVDLGGNIVFFNRALCRLLDRSPKELLGLNNRDFMDEATSRTVYEVYHQVYLSGKPNPGFSWQLTRPDGSRRFMETSVTLILDATGRAHGFRGILRDVSERIMIHRALFHEKERAQITLNAIADGVVRIDTDGRIEYLNPSASRLIGIAGDEVLGLPIHQIIDLSSDAEPSRTQEEMKRCLSGHSLRYADGQAHLRRPHGELCAIKFSAMPTRDSERLIVGAVVVFSDISEELRIREQLAYQAQHDALTGLGNRFRFETAVAELISEARNSQALHSLLYMDLDQFKIVNDTCGHQAGDRLLRELSGIISGLVRRDDLLARLGGDEFGLLLVNCPPERGAEIAVEVIRAVNQFEFHWDNQTFNVGISIGLVVIDGTSEATALLKAADQACYAAKDQGRNRFHVFSRDDDTLVQRSSELRAAASIDLAIRESRFEIYQQRIVDLTGRKGSGHRELLLRMRGRDGRPILPGAFLPGAERYGKMNVIDNWVVTRVFEKLGQLKRAGQLDPGDRFSVNLSGSTINDAGFQGMVESLLHSSGVDAGNLCFEITENSAIKNFRAATRFLQSMRKLGVRIMLDDFGSGLSSFTYLKNLPIDYLKIDGALVRDIADSSFDLAIIQAIQAVARTLGVPVVAEHVQSQAILDRLTSIGIEYAQGYYLHEPEPWLGIEEP